MRTVRANSWDDFRQFVQDIAGGSVSEAWRFAFRGLSDAGWPIRATIDRSRSFTTTRQRAQYEDRLLAAFRREAMAYVEPGSVVLDGKRLALLARHHGLPSSLTDWTTSPYIAAYFALSSVVPAATRVAVWTLDRDRLPDSFDDELNLIDDPLQLDSNTRAVRQRGIFIRVPEANTDLDALLAPALVKVTLPARVARVALTDLSYMTINASMLFNDLDGAARAANDRMLHGF